MKKMKILPYDKFFANHPNYQRYQSNEVATELYQELTKEDRIEAMKTASTHGRSAIAAVYKVIEKHHDTDSFDLSEPHIKQFIGALIRYILEPHGYVPSGQKRTGGLKEAKFFGSGTHYEMTREKFNEVEAASNKKPKYTELTNILRIQYYDVDAKDIITPTTGCMGYTTLTDDGVLRLDLDTDKGRGYKDILLTVSKVTLGNQSYKIVDRDFFQDGSALYIEVKKIEKD